MGSCQSLSSVTVVSIPVETLYDRKRLDAHLEAYSLISFAIDRIEFSEHGEDSSCRIKKMNYYHKGEVIKEQMRRLFHDGASITKMKEFAAEKFKEINSDREKFIGKCSLNSQQKEGILEKLESTAGKLKETVSNAVSNFKPFENAKKVKTNDNVNAAASRAALISCLNEHPLTNSDYLKEKGILEKVGNGVSELPPGQPPAQVIRQAISELRLTSFAETAIDLNVTKAVSVCTKPSEPKPTEQPKMDWPTLMRHMDILN